MMFDQVESGRFAEVVEDLRLCSPLHGENVDPVDPDPSTRFYANGDWTAGYAVTSDGELKYVWATARGMGDAILSAALERGATRLNCFEGHLTSLYSRHGFVETSRLANWTAGEPDVVFMELA